MYREGIKHHTVRCNGDINIFFLRTFIGLVEEKKQETGNPMTWVVKHMALTNDPIFILDPEYLRDPKSQKLVTWHVGEYTGYESI